MHPAFLDDMSWEMAEVYGAITDQILINLARHFPFYDANDPLPSSAFEYQASMLAQMGQVNAETMRIIRNGLADADEALKNTLEQAIIDSVRTTSHELLEGVKRGVFAPPTMPVLSPNQYRAFQLYYTQAADKLNLVNTVMLESTKSAYAQTITDVVSEIELADRLNRTQIALDAAAGETITGVSSWNQALRHATDKLKNGGITGFVDHAGHHWSAEAYTAMDIRTTTFNTARAAVWEENQSFGNDLYIVSYHNGARPLCYPWQNKVISANNNAGVTYDLDGNEIEVIAQSATSYGEAAGLFGINCKHYPTPWIPGVSLADGKPQDKEDNDRVYAESQEQRRLERKLREEKRDLMMAKAQGRPQEEIDRLQAKCRKSSEDIDTFCKETGRARHRDREAVYTKREFPDKEKYNVAEFERTQKEQIEQFYKNGGAQQNYTFGQMTPNETGTRSFYDEFGEAPERPRKADFANYEEFDKARSEYKEAKAQYEEKVGNWFDANYGNRTVTDEQLSEWMDRHGIKQYGSIDGLDRNALSSYMDRFDKLSADFPQVLEHRRNIGLPFEISYNPNAIYDAEASHGMSFGRSFENYKSFFLGHATQSTGMVHGVNPALSTFDHEFGHNLFDAMRKVGTPLDEITTAMTRTRVEMEKDLLQSLVGMDGMSEYATTNVDELFAEAFSAWYGGEKTPFANAFGDYLRRWGAIQ